MSLFAPYSSLVARRAWMAALALALAVSLVACSSEGTERKAFMAFLQTRIVDKPGIHVPHLTPSEEKSFGAYASHFAVIRNFSDAMDKTVAAPVQQMMSKGMPRSLPELLARRGDIATFRKSTADLQQGLAREVAKAGAARAALQQPDDLKAVYDKAYARTVSEPAAVFGELLPEAEASFASAEQLVVFLDKHSAGIKINGSQIEVSDPALHAQVNAMLQEMNAHAGKINSAGTRMRTLMLGR